MPHHVPLIATIAVGLALAFLLGFLATRIRLPPLIGYLLAGVVVGPFTPGFVADTNLASQLAEIGVILLMFGVGTHFSLQDLLAVRRVAIPGAIAQIVVATVLGAALAHAWGWSTGAGLIFGLSLSVASTVVLLKALEQRGTLDSAKGRIAVGWLIVEDLVTVLALVLLPVIVGSLGAETADQPLDWTALAGAIGLVLVKIAVFFVIVRFVGVRVFPWLFAQVAATGSRELTTLFVVGVALGIAYGSAIVFNVSFALGAFFAGVVINESKLTNRVAIEAVPLENAFAVLFFVSVGMLFDPTMVMAHAPQLLAVLAIVMVGKSLAALVIVLALRYSLGTALTVAASLAQIGEFSFILGALGISLGVLPIEGRNLIVAGAIISITLNPLMFRINEPLHQALRRYPRLLRWIDRSVVVESPDEAALAALRGHVVLVGYGRVGQEIGRALTEQGIAYAVVEQDRHCIDEVRAHGVPAVYGDGAIDSVLAHAGVANASVLVIATPDAFRAARMLDYARRVNPAIETVARTHSREELALLQQHGVGLALMAERELAVRMSGQVTRLLANRTGT